jgi:hypothetical protein
MKTHRADFVSLVLGLITIVAGFAATRARLGNLINDRPDALAPLVVLGIGVVAVAVATRRMVHAERDDATPDDVTS